ncbi:peroxiredoxin family protein [Thiomonas bhubaneswarensis]|uniref:Thiol-disulfide isomerase or thioredoxin n=1 Tax=Thiomonas bhubaneswarensis TaxID=339866 RepID=A0A0K6HX74_9BURK|nr:TlpA disulfide reductase family protein [Thiomonas bhubaneswarensis]CUA95408.1 Thiol-disulfide isomerase or thioredoxin [Thiomonas bhubaneswarensis]
MKSLSKSILAVVVLAVLAVGGYLGWSAMEQKPVAPNASFSLLDGKTVDLSSYRGKVLLVNFWATSCTTCVGEMPDLVKTYDALHPKGFDLVAVAMSYDNPTFVSHFTQQRQLPFSVAYDASGQTAKAFKDVRLTPTSFLIDKSGHIVKQYVGSPNFAELHQLIDRLLAQQA